MLLPWIVVLSPTNDTLFFSIGFTDTISRFIDIYSYTFRLTRGSFYGEFWFWHIALLLVLSAGLFAYLGRERVAAGALFLACLSVFRFSIWLSNPQQGIYALPFGCLTIGFTGLILYHSSKTK